MIFLSLFFNILLFVVFGDDATASTPKSLVPHHHTSIATVSADSNATQFQLPEDQRLLSVPELDAEQHIYKP